MSEEHTKSVIAALAVVIRARLAGGNLYGRPLDMDDPDAVLVAAWPLFQNEIKLQLERVAYDQWIAPLEPICEQDEVVTVRAPPGVADWCRQRLRTPIERTLSGVLGHPVSVSYLEGAIQ